jgi:hypothetical protein
MMLAWQKHLSDHAIQISSRTRSHKLLQVSARTANPRRKSKAKSCCGRAEARRAPQCALSASPQMSVAISLVGLRLPVGAPKRDASREMSPRFDRFAASAGGAFYTDPQRHPGSHLMIERCRSYVAGIVAALCSDPSSVNIEVNLIANIELNAVAGIQDGLDCIGINLGVGKTLESLFDNMLSDPECLPDIGDASLESRHEDFDPETYVWDPTGQTVPRPYRPKCSKRAEYATRLSNAAFYFFFFHELGHVFNGHVDWLHANFGFHSLDERTAATIPGLSTLDRQTLEMDADCFACQSLLLWILRVQRDPVTERPMVQDDFGLGSPIDIFFLCVFAIYSVFRIFSDEEITDEESILENEHPPAFFRQRYIWATLLEVNDKHGLIDQQAFLDCTSRAVTEVEHSFVRMTGRKPYQGLDLTRAQQLSAEILKKLLENWKVLRPNLEPLKRGGNLAP